ncbi:MAG: Uma2 family endonuclease [Anaerolineae bacterium]|nr:Uma2 family endonuclease [Anaerolineae bacterium]
MSVRSQRMTVDEFDQFVMLPENADRLLEYIGGEVIEVVSNQRASALASRFIGFIQLYLMQNRIGFVTGADGGYMIAGERYIPDVAFVSKTRQTEPSEQAYSAIPPDLVIEVLSPSNTPHEMRVKVVNYLSVGVTVWVADPDRKLVEVYTPGQPVKKVGIGGLLDGGDILPGFAIAVKDIFDV